MIRDAASDDVPALVALEARCFETDRLSARSFRRFLSRPTAELIVTAEDGSIRGYALVLYHRNASLARLYSIAVAPEARGRGLARALVAELERRALARGMTRLRLEVHVDNAAAQRLYREMGYREFAIRPDYYEDHASAVRMEKELAPHLAADLDRAPYYRQTLDFTCGPASLIMAMKTHDPDLVAHRGLEIQLWREATTVFMTAGHGGCAPLGLALAARRRGFRVEVSVSEETELFVDSVRSEEKKEVIRLVERRFLAELAETDIRVHPGPLGAAELCRRMAGGGAPVVLISSYRLTGERTPHWVALTACDDRFVYLNDPYVDVEDDKTETDCIGIPVLPRELDRMMRLGRRKHYAALIVYPRERDPAR